MFRDVWAAHQGLPMFLRVQWLVPGTVLLVAFLGLAFALPPGPLCDEGMILFMEGGCDWGQSNVFFYSKVGTMAALGGGFIVAWRARVKSLLAFVPHFCVASWLAWATRSGGRCDTYYSHPNGSEGQMVVELAAFAFLGMAILKIWSGASSPIMALAILGWTTTYVGVFYAGLLVVPHWTWTHTFLVGGTMILIGITMSSNRAAISWLGMRARTPIRRPEYRRAVPHNVEMQLRN